MQARYAPSGFRYTLQIRSDENKFAEPGLASTTASDFIAAATTKLKETAASAAAETGPRNEAVLRDWELYQAGKEDV